jgi:DNA-binding NarL/FixJ family response regulator
MKQRATRLAGVLTREPQVTRLARDGLSNPEIGTRLFISPRTAKYHLSSVFAKLGISSRSQLDQVLLVGCGCPAICWTGRWPVTAAEPPRDV